MKGKYTKKHVAITIVAMAVFCFVMYFGLMLRDYNLSFDGGPHFVAKEFIPPGPVVGLNNQTPGKLVARVNSNPNADGYELRISRFPNMLFAKNHASSFISNTKELSMLSGGATYYVQARYYVKNSANRKVNGQWGPVRSSTVKKKR